jgi:type IV pilus assembly protein PilC
MAVHVSSADQKVEIGRGRGALVAQETALRVRHVAGARALRQRELPVFTRELAALLSAGIPLLEALRTLQDQVASPQFKKVIQGVGSDVEHGTRFTKALARYPGVFDVMYVRMLQSGEVSGRLAETLDRLAVYLESSQELNRKVKSAMVYPVVVGCIALILFAAVMTWIVPAFEKIFQDLGGMLPRPTRLMIDLSRFLRHHALWVMAAAAVLSAGMRAFVGRTELGALLWDTVLLRLPVFGMLVKKVGLTRFAESLAQMLTNGIPILTALDLAAETLGNRVMRRAIVEARQQVSQGQPLSVSIARHRHYPALLVKLLGVGEKTGKTDEMLSKVAEFYKSEVAVMLTQLTALLEPMLIVFLGCVIGSMVLCLFLPIFKMSQVVSF